MAISFKTDFMLMPRPFEDSSVVAKSWLKDQDPYAVEDDADMPAAYHGIVAERLFLRSILGLPNQRPVDTCVTDSKPFGVDGPAIRDLLAHGVRGAVAFVPLTSEDKSEEPVLVRVYCVTGLRGKYVSSIWGDSPGNLCWFVSGISHDRLKEGIVGNSWKLAAALLSRIVSETNAAAALNLCRNFIVTGDVQDGRIKHVDMGRKPELVINPAYKNYRWIIPMSNANDDVVVNNLPTRKIEKPGSIEEAYRLIETMQNRATRSMFKFIRELNYDGFVDEYENGADIFAEDPDSGLTPLQMINKSVDWLLGLKCSIEDCEHVERNTELDETGKPVQVEKRPYKGSMSCSETIKRHTQERNKVKIMRFLKKAGADCAMCFYLMARQGEEKALKAMADSLCINAINGKDENGLTAGDWALMSKNWSAVSLLVKNGAVCDETGVLNPLIRETLQRIACLSHEDFEVLEHAFALGLPLSAKVNVNEYQLSYASHSVAPGVPLRLTIFAAALWEGNYEMAELCLKKGADPNAMLIAEERGFEPDGDFGWNEFNLDYPTMLVAKNLRLDKSHRNRLLSLLYSHGAKKRDEDFADSPEVKDLLNNIWAVRDNSSKCNVLIKALDCGLSPFAPTCYCTDEERVDAGRYEDDLPSTYHTVVKCTVPLIYAAAKLSCFPLLERCVWGVDVDAEMKAHVDDEEKHETSTVHLLDASNDKDVQAFLKQRGAKTTSSRKNAYL